MRVWKKVLTSNSNERVVFDVDSKTKQRLKEINRRMKQIRKEKYETLDYLLKPKVGHIDFVAKHKESKNIVSIDIKDFFGSLDQANIKELIKEDIEFMKSVFKRTKEKGVPMGLSVSNEVGEHLFEGIEDEYLMKIEQDFQLEIRYSRYCDDIMLSAEGRVAEDRLALAVMIIQDVLKENNMNLNIKKQKQTSSNSIEIAGVLIKNNQVHPTTSQVLGMKNAKKEQNKESIEGYQNYFNEIQKRNETINIS